MSNSKAYILRTILEPDIVDIIESHIRPHCLALLQYEAQGARARCMEELSQRLKFNKFFVHDDLMLRYRRLILGFL